MACDCIVCVQAFQYLPSDVHVIVQSQPNSPARPGYNKLPSMVFNPQVAFGILCMYKFSYNSMASWRLFADHPSSIILIRWSAAQLKSCLMLSGFWG